MNKELVNRINGGVVEIYDYTFENENFKATQRCFKIVHGVNVHMIGASIDEEKENRTYKWQPVIVIKLKNPSTGLQELIKLDRPIGFAPDGTIFIKDVIIKNLFRNYTKINAVEVNHDISFDSETDD